MRFTDFLKATVLISAGAATALAAVAVAGAAGDGETAQLVFGIGWWVAAGAIGLWMGRRGGPSPAISRLLAEAQTSHALPDVRPARVLLNRLWPLLLCTLPAGALAFLAPQVPAIAAGFALLWSLAWRRQEKAVTAIELRDGAAFYVDQTSPIEPIRLLRTPGFRGPVPSPNGKVEEEVVLDRRR